MTATGNANKVIVRLPQSENALFAALKAHGWSTKFAAGTLNRKRKFPIELQQTIQYSYPGLAHGRPLNKVMIMLVGQSGAGKSTTINALFNDQICETSCVSSQTCTVTEYGKELCVHDPSSASVVGTLSFVDPPGAFDTDQTKEASNFAIISKFRHEHSDLRSRKKMLKASLIIREHVYPNLILMVIHAADKMIEGPDEKLQKCLKALEKYILVDRLYPNLIAVVTHAMMIPSACYKQQVKLITHTIQEVVFDVLGLRKVRVVFVENKPQSYNMVKPEGYDFYQLPDGRLSHYNLIRAMEKQFDETGDDLGKLLCGWYFSDDCPEKQNKANILHSVKHGSLSFEETEEALQMLSNIDLQLIAEKDVVPPKFGFQFLGRGYCPKTEQVKEITVHQEENTVRSKLIDTVYTVPTSFRFEDADENHFLPISCSSKFHYEKRKASLYGIESNTKLVVQIDSNGRWVKNTSNQNPIVKTVYEKRLLSASIEIAQMYKAPSFMEVLKALPANYNEYNVECFQNFFSIYGSHFIQQTWIGGCVIINTPVWALAYNEVNEREMFDKLRDVFKNVGNLAKGNTEYISSPEGSDDSQVQKSELKVEGGDPPLVSTLAEFTAVRYADWVETVRRYPVELPHSFKLSPYYTLLESDRRKTALIQATKQYLEGTMLKPAPPRTPTKRYGMFFADVDQDTLRATVAEELKKGKAVSVKRLPSQLKRNEVGIGMVKRAQASSKKRCILCGIL